MNSVFLYLTALATGCASAPVSSNQITNVEPSPPYESVVVEEPRSSVASEPNVETARCERAMLLWTKLAETELSPPAKAAPLQISLPDDITVPETLPSDGETCRRVGGLRALGSTDHPIRMCCRRVRRMVPDAFMRGCRMPFACSFETEAGRAETTTELAALLGQVESPAEALGRVALLYPEILEPASFDPEPPEIYGFQGVPDAPPTFDIEATQEGYIVRAAAYPICGCIHHILRMTFHVERNGCVTLGDEEPEPIAWSQGLCVD